jgi:hypothetical protein
MQKLMAAKVKVPLWVFAGFALMLYAAWEIYWVSQVGYSAIKWHTHLMLYVYAWFCSLLLLLPLKRHRLINEIVLVVSITLFTLGSIELVLTLTGYNKTYIENRSGKYVSLFNETSTDSLRICHAPKTTHQLRSPEFNYPRQTNQYGFSDFIFRHDTGRVLVQTYGDSFTEGDGSPFDSSYPAILRQLLGEKYSVQNYGICGNDPAFYLPQYNHVGRLFHPNVMVFCYGSGDFMHDWATRGGLERFTPTGWQSQKGPWWEPIYALSYVARLFIEASGRHCNDFFMSPQEKEENLRALAPKWNELFVALANTAARDSTKILLLKKPERSEVALNKYQYDFAFFDSLVTTLPGVKHYDLLPFYRDTFGLKSQEATAPYYWPQDGHHNPAGYALMAKGVYQALQRNNQLQSYFIK